MRKLIEAYFPIDFSDGTSIDVWATCTKINSDDSVQDLMVNFFSDKGNPLRFKFKKEFFDVVEKKAEEALRQQQFQDQADELVRAKFENEE